MTGRNDSPEEGKVGSNSGEFRLTAVVIGEPEAYQGVLFAMEKGNQVGGFPGIVVAEFQVIGLTGLLQLVGAEPIHLATPPGEGAAIVFGGERVAVAAFFRGKFKDGVVVLGSVGGGAGGGCKIGVDHDSIV